MAGAAGEPSPLDLNYGHFGQAIYSIENGEWTFDRRPGHRGALHKLGSWKLAIRGVEQLDDTADAADPIRVRHAAGALCHHIPELAPALEIVPELALASAAVASTASTYDPAVGDLLSFGSFTPAQGNPRPGKRIAAVPTGEAGNILLLVPFTKERQGWGSDKSAWLEIPSFSDAEQAYWAEEAGPIRQLCFAQSEARSAFLAVRFPAKTTLFRPLQHHQRNPASRSRYYHLSASHIDPHPILSVSCEKTGGSSHAHVTFNFDYQRQFGIVDVKGKWSVWDIEGGQRGSKYSITRVALGRLAPDADDQVDEACLRQDGWARILWIGDVNTVLVCNRRRLQAYGLKGGETVPLDSFQPVPQHSADWILDIKKHDTNARKIFVLTSSRLYLLSVICQNDVLGYGELVPGVAVALSWAHFRGLEDITLQLHVPALSHQETKVFLFSRLNGLITVYQSRAHETEPSRPFSSSDPIRFSLDDLLGSSKSVQHVNGLHLEPLSIREGHRRLGIGPGSTYRARDVKFYHLSVMLSDRSVHQAVFYAAPRTSNIDSEVSFRVEAPTWTTITQSRASSLHSGEDVDDEDDFVLPDGIDGPAPTLKLPYQNPTISARARLSSPGHSEEEDSEQEDETDAVNFDSIYDSLSHGALLETGDDNPEVEDVCVIINRAKDTLDQTESNIAPGTTLLELTKAPIAVSDVDESSAQLQDLFIRQSPHTLVRIASQRVLQWSDDDEALPDMSSLYDALLETWIAPIPTSVPNHLRQSKERVARRLAAEVALANSQIRPPAAPERSSGSRIVVASSSQSQASVSVPSTPLPVESFREQRSMSSQLPSSQPEPGSAVFRSHPDPVARLRRHLQITKPPPTVSLSVKQVLMHWTPEADPGTYEWAATTRAVDKELGIDQDTEDLTEKERDRIMRKAERRLKRQKRELDLGQRNAQSQPVLTLRSSPPLIVRMSSQPQAATQSQPDIQSFPPFGFGAVQSRPAIRKKKKEKGRIGGF